jgi:phosphatidylglycerophosphate synthase
MSDLFDNLQTKSENWREKIGTPLLYHIPFQSHTITTFRLILAASFPFLILKFSTLAWTIIIISISLDAVDGMVARYQNKASDRGKFIDVLVDQLTFIFLGLGYILLIRTLSFQITCLIIIIPLTYLITIIRKNEKKPSDWLIKPQARLTGYKIAFLIIINSWLFNWLSFEHTVWLLWFEIIICSLHFSFHYYKFVALK